MLKIFIISEIGPLTRTYSKRSLWYFLDPFLRNKILLFLKRSYGDRWLTILIALVWHE